MTQKFTIKMIIVMKYLAKYSGDIQKCTLKYECINQKIV